MDPAARTPVSREVGQGAEIAVREKPNRFHQPPPFTHELIEFIPVADAPVTYYATFTTIAPHRIFDAGAADCAGGGSRIEALCLASQQIGKAGHVRKSINIADATCAAIAIRDKGGQAIRAGNPFGPEGVSAGIDQVDQVGRGHPHSRDAARP